VQARRSTEKARRRLIGWGLTLPILVLAISSAGAAGGPFFLSIPLPADSLLADGAPVVELDFSGTEVRSSLALDRVVRSTAPASGRPWSGRALDRVLGAILDSYREIGHLHAAITRVEVIEVEGGLGLEFLIDEGPPVLLGEIDITGNDLYDDATIRHLLGLDAGAPFVPDRFHEGIEHLLDRYENEGRPFAQVEPRDLIWDDEVRFTLAVREGRPVRVDAIQVSGNRVTRSSVVERISGLELGEPFAQVRIERAEARLRRSGLFSAVEPIELGQGADRTRTEVLIRVREGRTNFVNGAIGYGGEEQGVTGLFDLALGNLGGTGRRGSARWEGRGNGIALYNLRYSEPWILGSPVTAHVALARTIQDTLYTESALTLTGEVEVASAELRATRS
jgi:outer membrane protein assembly factor BamA